MEICPQNICTGCQACRMSCKHSAIQMVENEKGNIYPIINEEKCTGCQRCINTCPALHPISTNNQKQPRVFAGWTKNGKQRKRSTSGGLSFVISKHIVKNKGIFCGVIWTEQGAEHQICEDISMLNKFQGSKYAHSDVRNTYIEIQNLLKTGKKVLFTGTPCQVAGLKNFLRKEYDNLYTVDLVCHGVPSRLFLRQTIKNIEKKYNSKVIDIRFREKTPDQYHTSMNYYLENGKVDSERYSKSFFFRSFVDNYILRENCFHCQYSSLQRISDITLADFWNYTPYNLKFRSYRKGTSLILLNTDKGEELFSEIKNELIYEERSIQEALKSNQNLKKPQEKPQLYEEFWKDYFNGVEQNTLHKRYLTSPKEQDWTIVVKGYIKMVLPIKMIKLLKHL